MPPAARKRPLPDAEIDGAEVSWRFRKEMLATMPASSAIIGQAVADGAGAAATEGTPLASSYTSVRERRVASNDRGPTA
jgi:hypothetical protein